MKTVRAWQQAQKSKPNERSRNSKKKVMMAKLADEKCGRQSRNWPQGKPVKLRNQSPRMMPP